MTIDRTEPHPARLRRRRRTFDASAAMLCLVFAIVALFGGCGARAQYDVARWLEPSPGMQYTIDIDEPLENDELEARDQIRDWAVYGTLIGRGLSPEEIARATFRTAPVRAPYLDEMFLFDHGRGRRAVLLRDDVLLFVDDDDPDMLATLGRQADRVRMETGEIPEHFVIYRISRAGRTITVHEHLPVSGPALFTPEAGYTEKNIATRDDLEKWLVEVDDLTYMAWAKDGVSVTLGGRRSKNEKFRTQNLKLQDIAALYRAAKEAPNNAFSLDPKWWRVRLRTSLARLAADPCSLLGDAKALVTAAADDDIEEDAKPTELWAAERMLEIQRALEAQTTLSEACRALQTDYHSRLEDLVSKVTAQTSTSLDDKDMVELRQLSSELADKKEPRFHLLHQSLALVEARNRFQCARYVGFLAGTSVAMNLFYTDLLAKLWAGVDSHHSSPTADVPGFVSMTHAQDTLADLDEHNSNTRLWFAPSFEGISRSAEGLRLSFAHVATRVYAAGSDPLHPGTEGAPAEDSRRAIGWWNDHFAEVADHEPQYHVQNQIMKWSLVVSQLIEWERMSWLSDVDVDRSQTFDQWYEQNKVSLQYKYPLRVLSPGSGPTETECLPTFESYRFGQPSRAIQGGVSLGNRSVAASVPVIGEDLDRGLRHIPLGRSGKDAPGTASRVYPRWNRAAGLVEVTATETTTQRQGPLTMHVGRVSLSPGGRPGQVHLELSSDRGTISTLRGSAAGTRVALKVVRGPVELARDATACAAREGLFCNQRTRELRVVGLEEGGLVALFQDGGGATIVVGPDAASASPRPDIVARGGAHVAARLRSPDEMKALLAQYPRGQVTMRPGMTSPAGIRVILSRRSPPPEARRLLLTGVPNVPGGSLEVYVQLPSGQAESTPPGGVEKPRKDPVTTGSVWVEDAPSKDFLFVGTILQLILEAAQSKKDDLALAEYLKESNRPGDTGPGDAFRGGSEPGASSVGDNLAELVRKGDYAAAQRICAEQGVFSTGDASLCGKLVRLIADAPPKNDEDFLRQLKSPAFVSTDVWPGVARLLREDDHRGLEALRAIHGWRLKLEGVLSEKESELVGLKVEGKELLTMLVITVPFTGTFVNEANKRDDFARQAGHALIYIERRGGHGSIAVSIRSALRWRRRLRSAPRGSVSRHFP